jgi:hypothetical protein
MSEDDLSSPLLGRKLYGPDSHSDISALLPRQVWRRLGVFLRALILIVSPCLLDPPRMERADHAQIAISACGLIYAFKYDLPIYRNLSATHHLSAWRPYCKPPDGQAMTTLYYAYAQLPKTPSLTFPSLGAYEPISRVWIRPKRVGQ